MILSLLILFNLGSSCLVRRLKPTFLFNLLELSFFFEDFTDLLMDLRLR
jgi:hypothetical protein